MFREGFSEPRLPNVVSRLLVHHHTPYAARHSPSVPPPAHLAIEIVVRLREQAGPYRCPSDVSARRGPRRVQIPKGHNANLAHPVMERKTPRRLARRIRRQRHQARRHAARRPPRIQPRHDLVHWHHRLPGFQVRPSSGGMNSMNRTITPSPPGKLRKRLHLRTR